MRLHHYVNYEDGQHSIEIEVEIGAKGQSDPSKRQQSSEKKTGATCFNGGFAAEPLREACDHAAYSARKQIARATGLRFAKPRHSGDTALQDVRAMPPCNITPQSPASSAAV